MHVGCPSETSRNADLCLETADLFFFIISASLPLYFHKSVIRSSPSLVLPKVSVASWGNDFVSDQSVLFDVAVFSIRRVSPLKAPQVKLKCYGGANRANPRGAERDAKLFTSDKSPENVSYSARADHFSVSDADIDGSRSDHSRFLSPDLVNIPQTPPSCFSILVTYFIPPLLFAPSFHLHLS